MFIYIVYSDKDIKNEGLYAEGTIYLDPKPTDSLKTNRSRIAHAYDIMHEWVIKKADNTIIFTYRLGTPGILKDFYLANQHKIPNGVTFIVEEFDESQQKWIRYTIQGLGFMDVNYKETAKELGRLQEDESLLRLITVDLSYVTRYELTSIQAEVALNLLKTYPTRGTFRSREIIIEAVERYRTKILREIESRKPDPKPIRVCSLDFEDCVFNDHYQDARNRREPEVEAPLVVKYNRILLDKLLENAHEYSETIFMCGSNRQSKDSDVANSYIPGTSRNTESSFAAIVSLEREFRKKARSRSSVNTFLLADLYNKLPSGTAYGLASNFCRDFALRHPEAVMDGSKISIVLAQSWEIARENPNVTIHLEHFDNDNFFDVANNKKGIIETFRTFFKPESDFLPARLRFGVNHYEGGAVTRVFHSQGTNRTNIDYQRMIRKVATGTVPQGQTINFRKMKVNFVAKESELKRLMLVSVSPVSSIATTPILSPVPVSFAAVTSPIPVRPSAPAPLSSPTRGQPESSGVKLGTQLSTLAARQENERRRLARLKLERQQRQAQANQTASTTTVRAALPGAPVFFQAPPALPAAPLVNQQNAATAVTAAASSSPENDSKECKMG